MEPIEVEALGGTRETLNAFMNAMRNPEYTFTMDLIGNTLRLLSPPRQPPVLVASLEIEFHFWKDRREVELYRVKWSSGGDPTNDEFYAMYNGIERLPDPSPWPFIRNMSFTEDSD